MIKLTITDKNKIKEVREFLTAKCANNSEYSMVTCGYVFGKFVVSDDARDYFLPELAKKVA